MIALSSLLLGYFSSWWIYGGHFILRASSSAAHVHHHLSCSPTSTERDLCCLCTRQTPSGHGQGNRPRSDQIPILRRLDIHHCWGCLVLCGHDGDYDGCGEQVVDWRQLHLTRREMSVTHRVYLYITIPISALQSAFM